MICDFYVTMFFLVCFVCIVKIFIPRVFSLQSLTLGTRVLFCGIFEQVMSPVVLNMVMFLIRPVS